MAVRPAGATARLDRSAFFIVAAVAAVHLAALHPVSLDGQALKKEPDEVPVVIEVAPNRPVPAAVTTPADRPARSAATLPPTPAPRPAAAITPATPVGPARPASPSPASPAQASPASASTVPLSPAPPSPASVPSPDAAAPPPAAATPPLARPVASSPVRPDAAVTARAAEPAPTPAEAVPPLTTQASYEVGSAQNPRPPYPPAAYFARVQGRVVLRVQVQSDGRPGEIVLLQSSGSPLLDRSALDTVARWQLKPARRGDQPVEQWIEVPISFRLIESQR